MTGPAAGVPDMFAEPLRTDAKDAASWMVSAVGAGNDRRYHHAQHGFATAHGSTGMFVVACWLVMIAYRDAPVPIEVHVYRTDGVTVHRVASETLPASLRAIIEITTMVKRNDIDGAWAVWLSLSTQDTSRLLKSLTHAAAGSVLRRAAHSDTRSHRTMLSVTSKVTSPDVFGRPETRQRLVCPGCDMRIYLAVAPADEVDEMVLAVEKVHHCRTPDPATER